MSIMHPVAGYLLIFDVANADPFGNVLFWINYIINEKRASEDHPIHFILVGVVFPDKKREISVAQAKVIQDPF
jgi:hypothetical protein